MATIPTARFSKPNCLVLHLKHCSFLTNAKCETVLNRGYHNIWNGHSSFNTLKCGISGDKVRNVFWRAHNLPAIRNVKNVIMCGTNNLYLDAPEDIANQDRVDV